jgi:hypothetical protein
MKKPDRETRLPIGLYILQQYFNVPSGKTERIPVYFSRTAPLSPPGDSIEGTKQNVKEHPRVPHREGQKPRLSGKRGKKIPGAVVPGNKTSAQRVLWLV